MLMDRMDRRGFLSLTTTGLAVCAVGCTSDLTRQTAKRPNVLIIITDDQGYGDFSCHGNPFIKTPNIDQLHGESVRFTDFHVAPMCTPTRGQLMTGLDALHNRATSVTAGRAVMQPGLATMPEIFAGSGYATGMFGKWHLGDCYPHRPMDRGFETAVWFKGWGVSSAPEFDNDCFNIRFRRGTETHQAMGYCTDVWFDEAMRWMKDCRDAGRPFFCYVPTNAPHGPLWVDEKYSKPYRRDKLPADFYGMIANIDENIGRMEEFLRRTGLHDNTIVVFMTDNGGTAGVKMYNAGLRAGKTTYYDGGHRVPCFVRWPAGRLRPPVDVDIPTQIQDLLPTLIDFCSLKFPAAAHLDGRSLLPLLRDLQATLPERMLIVQYGQNPAKWDSCVIWGRWRLVRGEELYDIRADRAQEKNMAAEHPDVVTRMREHYEAWWAPVEATLSDYVPISIGSPKENPVFLSSSDWEVVYCDNVGHVREAAGGPRGSSWHMEVEREGEYEIELRRWPFHTDSPLASTGPGATVYGRPIAPGKSLPIAGAILEIAGGQYSAESAGTDLGTVFRVLLARGRTKLHGWFHDAGGNDLCGAFYARVTKL